MEPTELYGSTRRNLVELADQLGVDQIATPVSALPGWTVKDAFAHLGGSCSDLLAGNLEGAGSDAWTGVQVAARAMNSLPEITGEWMGHSAKFDQWLTETPAVATTFVLFDVWMHEQDIRSALGETCVRHDDRVDHLMDLSFPIFHRRFEEAGVPALTIITEDEEHVIGQGDSQATLDLDKYEALRLFFGRRSRAQMTGAKWQGDSTPYIDHLHILPIATIDLHD